MNKIIKQNFVTKKSNEEINTNENKQSNSGETNALMHTHQYRKFNLITQKTRIYEISNSKKKSYLQNKELNIN